MKSEKIKQKIQQTKEKRKSQLPIVIQSKLQNLSKRKIEILQRLFLEAKWLYNWLIADINRINLSTKEIKNVEIKVKENIEKRELTVIGSQIKQGIQERIKQALKALKNSKANGNKIGKLKFKSRVNSIPLKQYGITYKIDKQHNKVKIQNLGSFRVLGLRQISDDMEIANGFLVKKADGYYLHIVCYKQKEKITEIEKPIAIDFGIENKINLKDMDDRDINSARNMLEIALNRVDEKWLTLTEEEIELIERLFRNIKRYINWTDGKLSPEKGKLLILMRRGSHHNINQDFDEARNIIKQEPQKFVENLKKVFKFVD